MEFCEKIKISPTPSWLSLRKNVQKPPAYTFNATTPRFEMEIELCKKLLFSRLAMVATWPM